MCRRNFGGRFMNRFAEFSAAERCALLVSLGRLVDERQAAIEENPRGADVKSWVAQAHLCAKLRNELVMECYKKIRSA